MSDTRQTFAWAAASRGAIAKSLWGKAWCRTWSTTASRRSLAGVCTRLRPLHRHIGRAACRGNCRLRSLSASHGRGPASSRHRRRLLSAAQGRVGHRFKNCQTVVGFWTRRSCPRRSGSTSAVWMRNLLIDRASRKRSRWPPRKAKSAKTRPTRVAAVGELRTTVDFVVHAHRSVLENPATNS